MATHASSRHAYWGRPYSSQKRQSDGTASMAISITRSARYANRPVYDSHDRPTSRPSPSANGRPRHRMPYAYRSKRRHHTCGQSDGHHDIDIEAQTAPDDYAYSSGNSKVHISASLSSDKSTTETLTGRPHIRHHSSIAGFDASQRATSASAHMRWSPHSGSKYGRSIGDGIQSVRCRPSDRPYVAKRSGTRNMRTDQSTTVSSRRQTPTTWQTASGQSAGKSSMDITWRWATGSDYTDYRQSVGASSMTVARRQSGKCHATHSARRSSITVTHWSGSRSDAYSNGQSSTTIATHAGSFGQRT